MELYINMMWDDARLNFANATTAGHNSFFQLSYPTDVSQLWLPPMFLSNAQKTEQPRILNENKVVLLLSNGSVILQTR